MIIILGLIAFILYLQSKLADRDNSFLESPYCLRLACSDTTGKLPEAYKLTEDKQGEYYQTVNWCLVNGPSINLQKFLNRDYCSMRIGDLEYIKELEAYAKFYNGYLESCGYNWKTPSNIPSADEIINESRNQNGLNSNRDDFGKTLLECASTILGRTSLIDNDIKTKYPELYKLQLKFI